MKSDHEKTRNNHFRIAVLGHSNVGKSALTVRYLTRRYIGEYRSNSDLLYRQTVNVQNSQLDVEIVDVSGETRDLDFPTELVQWADACLLVYSITDRASFDTACRLLGRFAGVTNTENRAGGGKGPVLGLLANKADLEHLRNVTESEGSNAAAEQNCYFTELSVAENSDDVIRAFETILLQCKNPVNSSGNINKIPPFQLISQLSNDSNKSVRKFSVTKMLGQLIGKHTQQQQQQQQSTSGTVKVCQRSDLYRNKVLQRRHNFMAAAVSL